MITASNQYGITVGSYTAEILELTPLGRIATDPNSRDSAKLQAQLRLGIQGIEPFNSIYEQYKDNRLPTVEVLRDAAKNAGIIAEQAAECVEIFLANARELGLVRTIGGSEHIVKIDAAVALLGDVEPDNGIHSSKSNENEERPSKPDTFSATLSNIHSVSWDPSNVCFIISPIGQEGSPERKHADLMLSSLIEPALSELGLVAVRADQISKPGLITGQVIEHVVQSKLVIADLSFSNPNVYYELALRHATRKPTVQIIRTSDRLPFDVGQFRTVRIDMTDIYTLVPQLALHQQEIARQARAAIDDLNVVESPLSQFYPNFWSEIHKP